ncbi:DUF1330 domain-containing protein [Mesorhizobium sp. B2-3-13]|uniref:DUF1330 domain-containing protein n=1 Tax=Mesorhizobium sp. B2-3-13 TaxID=2589951 RepID=UPI00112AB595|nr:DUF1330 domain-containing protein [Mesorhizobium sp. B2-3-13]TPL76575.1 DUF1330 domain-containing protein [Mesorhizobium sp. B2-3-13]
MPAYVISDVTVRDEKALQTYAPAPRPRSPGMAGVIWCAAAKCRRWSDWHPGPLIVVEFPDIERARRWYASAEYAAALEVRDAALSRHLILVEGMAP